MSHIWVNKKKQTTSGSMLGPLVHSTCGHSSPAWTALNPASFHVDTSNCSTLDRPQSGPHSLRVFCITCSQGFLHHSLPSPSHCRNCRNSLQKLTEPGTSACQALHKQLKTGGAFPSGRQQNYRRARWNRLHFEEAGRPNRYDLGGGLWARICLPSLIKSKARR